MAVIAYTQGNFKTAQTFFNTVSGYQDAGKYLQYLQILIAAQGTWENPSDDFRIIFEKWAIKSSDKHETNMKSEYYSQSDIKEEGLMINFSDVVYVFNYSELKLVRFDSEGSEFTKIAQSSVPFSSPPSTSSPSSSSSSECDTLNNNLDMALLLSGGETTDLTILYTKALMDKGCFD